MATKKRVDVPAEEVLARHKAANPEFARLWDESTPARVVALELISYRSRHGVSQAQLADLLGVKQPQIARWESGDSFPSPSSLARLAGKLGLEIVISYSPTDKPKYLTKRALDDAESYEDHGATVHVAIT